jgi:predicted nucleotide-binding protein (sugar kinase/HSP70/actin superfamily)
MNVLYRCRPYEKVPGSANRLHAKWRKRAQHIIQKGNLTDYHRLLQDIVKAFDALELDESVKKPKVGVVGEILVKYMPMANNNLVELLEAEGAQVVVPEMLGFFMYGCLDSEYKSKYLGKSKKTAMRDKAIIVFLEWCRKAATKELAKSKRFTAPASIYHIARLAAPVVDIGNQTGEGWFLTGEMVELLEQGVGNIVCAQPFACLPNHIVGKGVIKEMRSRYPKANIVAIDYDPGASEVNQLNRIKLMLSGARERMSG